MSLKVAVIQFNAKANKEKNVSRALAFVKRAIGNNAKLICLPEVFNYRGKTQTARDLTSVVESIPGQSSKPFIDLAKKYKVHILAGSILEKSNKTKAYNTSLLIGPTGKILAKYRKQNLFDAVLGKKVLKESKLLLKGKRIARANVNGFKIGLSICYDLRFPDLYQTYAKNDVHVFCVPSAFTKKTGQAHWEPLLKARAIETLSYVLAPNQTGVDGKGVAAYGHSMIIDPWGSVLARASGNKEQIIYAKLNKAAIRNSRGILPMINRRSPI